MLSPRPRTARTVGWLGVAAALVAGLALGCGTSSTAVGPAPVVRNQTFRMPPGTLDKIAVMPLETKATFERYAGDVGTSAQNAADLIGRFLTEALMKHGMTVVAPSDVAIALTGRGGAPTLQPTQAAAIVAKEFGATALLVGRVNRYREREGQTYGAQKGASVAFEVSIFGAPQADKVWTSSFDETQRALGENIWNARRYPGGGTRWLTASELAQWGVDSAVGTLPSRR